MRDVGKCGEEEDTHKESRIKGKVSGDKFHNIAGFKGLIWSGWTDRPNKAIWMVFWYFWEVEELGRF